MILNCVRLGKKGDVVFFLYFLSNKSCIFRMMCCLMAFKGIMFDVDDDDVDDEDDISILGKRYFNIENLLIGCVILHAIKGRIYSIGSFEKRYFNKKSFLFFKDNVGIPWLSQQKPPKPQPAPRIFPI